MPLPFLLLICIIGYAAACIAPVAAAYLAGQRKANANWKALAANHPHEFDELVTQVRIQAQQKQIQTLIEETQQLKALVTGQDTQSLEDTKETGYAQA